MAVKAKHVLANALGWYGAAAIVAAYALVSFKLIPAAGIAYQLLNLTGALGILFIAEIKGVFQSVTVNAIWAVIALVALAQIIWR